MASADWSPSECLLLSGDARLADYGALLVFRHWLRCQLQELAGLDEESLYPFRSLEPEAASEHPEQYGRLFF